MADPRELLADIKARADESWRAWNPTDPRNHPSESVHGGVRARRLTFESQEDVAPLVAALTAVLDLHRPVKRATSASSMPGYETTYREVCLSCEATYLTYPCGTVRAITEALEGGSS